MDVNPAPLNKILSELPGIDLETGISGTSVVTHEVHQSNMDHIKEKKKLCFNTWRE